MLVVTHISLFVCVIPEDGGWSLWGTWQACAVTCGEGMRQRYRSCDSPKPMYGGKDCEGSPEEHMPCSGGRPCPGKRACFTLHIEHLHFDRPIGNILSLDIVNLYVPASFPQLV